MLKFIAPLLVTVAVSSAQAADTCCSKKNPTPRPTSPNVAPAGFTALFNGKDLTNWRGQGRDLNPYEIAKWSEQERKEKQASFDEDMRQHWRVENGEIINDGHGVYLTTAKDYRDFEFVVDWKMTPGTDSGIYLRGSPQVQIWDSLNKVNPALGIEKGSGALWNNKGPGKWPLVRADKPVGEWNTFFIRMIGERVTVWFNDQLTVDNAPLENYWDRSKPMLPTGPIQLQTHGGEMRFRNIFVREIDAEEANKILQGCGDEGFKSIFNGKDLDGWIGATDQYSVKDGAITFTGKGGGNLYYKEPLADFAIRFEFKLPPAGNNGLIVRAPLEGNPAFEGLEIQILDDGHEKYKDLKDWQVHGSIYGVAPAHRGYLRPVGEWNFEEVIVKGSKVTVYLNGTKINEADLSNAKPVDDREHPGLKRTEGYIGFMGHGDPVAFRNIRIKPL
ncbi:MAG TPA: DUF1080 domain-containing protein [Phycisphaerae bacterium]|nr:DUF1080 domain-containing protein [Phycisphaerae bacterium]HOJ75029.1 DUF1080 domain-containing protein [Phycisphaerae bacterium]HOM51900.1 DUF1080 domain-containing protein [Phycisphaerae bacterium]HON69075.1 DUF1080 domain-containing protein [Phycisphaerae bacterium]HOQ84918.1 DUF1080 domain-containing protein [Phycisphaerae bacterium]